jgi:preprotein translocase subunit SecE
MLENTIAVVASLIIAGIMVYVIDKYFGGTDDSEPLL